MNYYDKEISSLINETDWTIQMSDWKGNKTKHLSINVDSIPVIIKALKRKMVQLKGE